MDYMLFASAMLLKVFFIHIFLFFHVKMMKFVANFEKSVPGSYESLLGDYHKDKVLGLSNDSFRSKIELMIKMLFKF